MCLGWRVPGSVRGCSAIDTDTVNTDRKHEPSIGSSRSVNFFHNQFEAIKKGMQCFDRARA